MSHYDVLEVTDVISAATDDLGDVVIDLDISERETLEGARFRQQLGVRAMPNTQHSLDAVFARTGDEAEVFSIADADATEALEKVKAIAAGETQLYSTGSNPRAISVTDAEIKLGLRAKDAIACEGDEVDVGIITIKSLLGVISTTYVDPFTGKPGEYPLGTAIPLRGKIKPTSRKSKAE